VYKFEQFAEVAYQEM